MSSALKDNDIAKAIKGMDGWSYDDVYRCIRKEFDFDGVPIRMDFRGSDNPYDLKK